MRLRHVLTSMLVAGCGGGATVPPPSSPPVVVVDAKPRPVSALPEAIPQPDAITSLESLVPATATIAAFVPAFDDATRAWLAGPGGELALRAIAERAKAPPDALRALLDASAGLVVCRGEDGGFAVAARVRDVALADRIATSLELTQVGAHSFRVPRRHASAGNAISIDRFAKAGVLVVSTSDLLRARVLERAAGGGSAVARPPAAAPESAWIVADLARLSNDASVMGQGSRLEATFARSGVAIDLRERGEAVPRIARVLAPGAPTALGKLPEGALGGIAVSIRRVASTTVTEVLRELDHRPGDALVDGGADLMKEYAHRSLASLDDALGDEVAIALYPSADAGRREPLGAVTVVATVDTRNDRAAKELVAGIERFLRRSNRHTWGDGDDRMSVEVLSEKGRILMVVGRSRDAAQRLAETRKPPRTLRDAAPRALEVTPNAAVHAHAFADLGAIARLLPEAERPPSPPGESAFRSLTLSFRPTDDGMDAALRSSDGADPGQTARVFAALASHGVRRYVQASKTLEAKNTIGAITRGAIGAYEREMAPPLGAPPSAQTPIVHVLCGSATPVPKSVPRGTKHRPSTEPGADFQTGTDAAGWRCLKIDMNASHHYQYEYRRGGPYKGPARGGPDPGPNGFEVSAEGDLDGDGNTSLFTQVGTIDPATQTVRLRLELFVADETE